MAKKYFNDLQGLCEKLSMDIDLNNEIELKHFFSGAALYKDSSIRVSLSPMGLAFKLSDEVVNNLISNGDAVPLKYFPKGNVKNGYAMFSSPDLSLVDKWKLYFETAFRNHL